MDNLIKTKNKLIHVKGNYSDYDEESMQDVIFYAEDKKKIIVDGIEYGLDLESDEVDLISNIDFKDNKLTITFSNGKTKEIELEDHRAYWEEIDIPDISKGVFIVKTHPANEFKIKPTKNSNGIAYFNGNKAELPVDKITTIDLGEDREHTILFVITEGDGFDLSDINNQRIKHISYIPNSDNIVKQFSYIKNEDIEFEIIGKPTSIGNNAFQGCSGFTGDLIIPESVTRIENSAFSRCTGFTSLKLSESVTYIGQYTFNKCSGFTGELVIPESVTRIGYGAFSRCTGFTGELILPESLISIGQYAFSDCKGLSKIYVCEDVDLSGNFNSGTPAEVIKYKKGEKPWL